MIKSALMKILSILSNIQSHMIRITGSHCFTKLIPEALMMYHNWSMFLTKPKAIDIKNRIHPGPGIFQQEKALKRNVRTTLMNTVFT